MSNRTCNRIVSSFFIAFSSRTGLDVAHASLFSLSKDIDSSSEVGFFSSVQDEYNKAGGSFNKEVMRVIDQMFSIERSNSLESPESGIFHMEKTWEVRKEDTDGDTPDSGRFSDRTVSKNWMDKVLGPYKHARLNASTWPLAEHISKLLDTSRLDPTTLMSNADITDTNFLNLPVYDGSYFPTDDTLDKGIIGSVPPSVLSKYFNDVDTSSKFLHAIRNAKELPGESSDACLQQHYYSIASPSSEVSGNPESKSDHDEPAARFQQNNDKRPRKDFVSMWKNFLLERGYRRFVAAIIKKLDTLNETGDYLWGLPNLLTIDHFPPRPYIISGTSLSSPSKPLIVMLGTGAGVNALHLASVYSDHVIVGVTWNDPKFLFRENFHLFQDTHYSSPTTLFSDLVRIQNATNIYPITWDSHPSQFLDILHRAVAREETDGHPLFSTTPLPIFREEERDHNDIPEEFWKHFTNRLSLKGNQYPSQPYAKQLSKFPIYASSPIGAIIITDLSDFVTSEMLPHEYLQTLAKVFSISRKVLIMGPLPYTPFFVAWKSIAELVNAIAEVSGFHITMNALPVTKYTSYIPILQYASAVLVQVQTKAEHAYDAYLESQTKVEMTEAQTKNSDIDVFPPWGSLHKCISKLPTYSSTETSSVESTSFHYYSEFCPSVPMDKVKATDAQMNAFSIKWLHEITKANRVAEKGSFTCLVPPLLPAYSSSFATAFSHLGAPLTFISHLPVLPEFLHPLVVQASTLEHGSHWETLHTNSASSIPLDHYVVLPTGRVVLVLQPSMDNSLFILPSSLHPFDLPHSRPQSTPHLLRDSVYSPAADASALEASTPSSTSSPLPVPSVAFVRPSPLFQNDDEIPFVAGRKLSVVESEDNTPSSLRGVRSNTIPTASASPTASDDISTSAFGGDMFSIPWDELRPVTVNRSRQNQESSLEMNHLFFESVNLFNSFDTPLPEEIIQYQMWMGILNHALKSSPPENSILLQGSALAPLAIKLAALYPKRLIVLSVPFSELSFSMARVAYMRVKNVLIVGDTDRVTPLSTLSTPVSRQRHIPFHTLGLIAPDEWEHLLATETQFAVTMFPSTSIPASLYNYVHEHCIPDAIAVQLQSLQQGSSLPQANHVNAFTSCVRQGLESTLARFLLVSSTSFFQLPSLYSILSGVHELYEQAVSSLDLSQVTLASQGEEDPWDGPWAGQKDEGIAIFIETLKLTKSWVSKMVAQLTVSTDIWKVVAPGSVFVSDQINTALTQAYGGYITLMDQIFRKAAASTIKDYKTRILGNQDIKDLRLLVQYATAQPRVFLKYVCAPPSGTRSVAPGLSLHTLLALHPTETLRTALFRSYLSFPIQTVARVALGTHWSLSTNGTEAPSKSERPEFVLSPLSLRVLAIEDATCGLKLSFAFPTVVNEGRQVPPALNNLMQKEFYTSVCHFHTLHADDLFKEQNEARDSVSLLETWHAVSQQLDPTNIATRQYTSRDKFDASNHTSCLENQSSGAEKQARIPGSFSFSVFGSGYGEFPLLLARSYPEATILSVEGSSPATSAQYAATVRAALPNILVTKSDPTSYLFKELSYSPELSRYQILLQDLLQASKSKQYNDDFAEGIASFLSLGVTSFLRMPPAALFSIAATTFSTRYDSVLLYPEQSRTLFKKQSVKPKPTSDLQQAFLGSIGAVSVGNITQDPTKDKFATTRPSKLWSNVYSLAQHPLPAFTHYEAVYIHAAIGTRNGSILKIHAGTIPSPAHLLPSLDSVIPTFAARGFPMGVSFIHRPPLSTSGAFAAQYLPAGLSSGVVRVDLVHMARTVAHHFRNELDGHQRTYTLHVIANYTSSLLLAPSFGNPPIASADCVYPHLEEGMHLNQGLSRVYFPQKIISGINVTMPTYQQLSNVTLYPQLAPMAIAHLGKSIDLIPGKDLLPGIVSVQLVRNDGNLIPYNRFVS